MTNDRPPAEFGRAVRESAAPAIAPQSDQFVLAGERFAVSEEGGQFFITHPQWSLTGSGGTIAEACTDLIAEARDLTRALQHDGDDTLSAEGRRLKSFVQRLG